MKLVFNPITGKLDYILGSSTANYIAYWSAATALTGAATLTYDPTTSPNLLLTAANAAHVAGVVKAAATQTANILQVQKSDGTVLAGFDERGVLFSNGSASNTVVFIGDDAGNTASTGTWNIALGIQALKSVTTGNNNVAIGLQSAQNLTGGDGNVFIGGNSGWTGVHGDGNFGLGAYTLQNNTGSYNVAIGASALNSQTSGSFNLGFGRGAGGFNVTGDNNVWIGYQAGRGASNQSNSNNVGLGYQAGYSLTTGSSNVFLGMSAGYRQTTNSSLLIVDNQQRANAATELTNAILYGAMAAASTDQTLRINAVTTLGNNAVIGVGTAGADYTLTFDGETNDGVLTWMEDEDYFEFADAVAMDGDAFWIGDGSGVPYGSCYGNEIGWTQASAVQDTWYNISDTDMVDGSGGLNLFTHDGSGKLTVTKAGRYQVNVSISMECNATGKHIQLGIEVSGSGSAVNDGIIHWTTRVANEQFALSTIAQLDLAADATIEACIRTTDTGTPNFAVDHLTITAFMLGGT